LFSLAWLIQPLALRNGLPGLNNPIYYRLTAETLPEVSTDLRFIQALPGNSSFKTTTVYTHLTNKGVGRIQCQPDKLTNSHKKDADEDSK